MALAGVNERIGIVGPSPHEMFIALLVAISRSYEQSAGMLDYESRENNIILCIIACSVLSLENTKYSP